MIQNGGYVVILSITYFPLGLPAALVFVGYYKNPFLIKVSLVYFLYGVIRNSFLVAENKLVLIGEELFVPECEQPCTENCRGAEKERRSLSVDSQSAVISVLFLELLI